MKDIQWYPGHMTKAKRMMQENIKLIDIVIELVDARVPFSSKNPDIDELAKNKYRMILLNKSDLADNKTTAKWESYYKDKGYFVYCLDSRKNTGMKTITDMVQEACKEKIERDRKRGILNRPIRAMVVGIPNVGKSTFINSYAKKACAKVGNKPGVTKGKQWIRISKNVELLDTPGILWPKFEDQEIGKKLAYIGSINDEIIEKTELAYNFIEFLKNNYCNVLIERYNINSELSAYDILSEIAIARKCIVKGNEPDINKAANILFDDFRCGKLGNISLEFPE
ncbi:MAG: ribosome biogenesis GTPase YlqF [Lachnospiraceae bacterium]|nr:ribosome biogenesis GTPase YlqF [Lachnospiraceae bacterium]